MKIGIIGNYGATNIGDDAILSAILKRLDDHKVTVFSAHPDMTKELFKVDSTPLFPSGLRSLFRQGFKEPYKALKDQDAVILGGGGLFQDSYLYACFLWAWQIFWVRRLKKPLFIYATGVGPLNTWLGRKLTKWAHKKAEVITVRDQYSSDQLQRIGFRGQVMIAADPVFDFRALKSQESRTKNLFIISLRPWLKHDKHTLSVMGDFLQKLKEEKQAEFIFVSMQQIAQHDLKMIEPLVSRMGGEIYLPRYFADLLKVMQRAEFAIGMRYHFMIAAIITKTPLLPISYSPKTEALFEDSKLAEYLSKVDKLSKSKLEADLKKLSAGYNNAVLHEKQLLDKFSKASMEAARELKSFLKRFDNSKASPTPSPKI